MSQSIVEIRYFHTPGVEGLRTIGSVLLSLVLWGGGGVSDMFSEMDLKENHSGSQRKPQGISASSWATTVGAP